LGERELANKSWPTRVGFGRQLYVAR
jgi:hypothetical protein